MFVTFKTEERGKSHLKCRLYQTVSYEFEKVHVVDLKNVA